MIWTKKNLRSFLKDLLREIGKIKTLVKELIGRIVRLEGNSHPPVNWNEIIASNVERIERLEKKMGNHGEGLDSRKPRNASEPPHKTLKRRNLYKINKGDRDEK